MAIDHKVADPAPLGLAAFGLTTIMLSSANAGLWHSVGGAAVVGTALFYGGLTQLLAGMWEFMRGNTFGATAFSTFGAFWLSVWFWITHPALQVAGSLGVFLMCFGIITFILWIAAIKHSMHLNLLFLALTLTFIFLSYGNWAGGHSGAVKTGGWLGLLTAAIALYTAAKTLVNDSWGREVLP